MFGANISMRAMVRLGFYEEDRRHREAADEKKSRCRSLFADCEHYRY